MNISIKNNSLIISGIDSLKDYEKGNLEFMNFVKSDQINEYICEPSNTTESLIELLKYLDKEKISYVISDECKFLLKDHHEIISSFNEIKRTASEFKKGKIEKHKLIKFKNRLKKVISEERELKEHQIKAAYHLYNIKNGANFSVPGSGKTAVILSVYELLKSEGKVNTLYVVGPVACFGPWKTEFKLTLNRIPKYKILAGGDKEKRKFSYYATADSMSELYLTSYQTLLSDQEFVKLLLKQEGIKAFLVIDEAHYIKKLDGEWANAVLNIGSMSAFRSILTGTPFPRSYADVFNLFDFLWPDIKILNNEVKYKLLEYENQNQIDNATKLLNEFIGPLFYRVRKKDLKLKKQNFLKPIIIKMNHYEKILYQAIETRIKDYPKEEYARNIELISRLYKGRIIRLRQAVSYPRLLQTAINGYNEDLLDDNSELKEIITNYDTLEKPNKLLYLISLVKELNQKGLKVVIWSHFIDTIKLIKGQFDKINLASKIIFGGIPIEKESCLNEETREKIRNEFVDINSGLDILIANPAAASESISLHKTCFHAIYYDLSYNAAQYLQSLDRIHRVGGSEVNTANYYFLQYENSIDQDIKRNLEMKANKMYSIIDKDYEIYNLDMFEDSEDDDIAAYKRIFGQAKN